MRALGKRCAPVDLVGDQLQAVLSLLCRPAFSVAPLNPPAAAGWYGNREELRAKAQYALDKGLPIMVTEWGSVNPNGDGDVDYESVDAWMDFIREHRQDSRS